MSDSKKYYTFETKLSVFTFRLYSLDCPHDRTLTVQDKGLVKGTTEVSVVAFGPFLIHYGNKFGTTTVVW